jgi:hypothetical protein
MGAERCSLSVYLQYLGQINHQLKEVASLHKARVFLVPKGFGARKPALGLFTLKILLWRNVHVCHSFE